MKGLIKIKKIKISKTLIAQTIFVIALVVFLLMYPRNETQDTYKNGEVVKQEINNIKYKFLQKQIKNIEKTYNEMYDIFAKIKIEKYSDGEYGINVNLIEFDIDKLPRKKLNTKEKEDIVMLYSLPCILAQHWVENINIMIVRDGKIYAFITVKYDKKINNFTIERMDFYYG